MQSCHESISSSILMYLTLRRATSHVSTVAAGQRRRTLQTAAGHYIITLLCRLVAMIDVLRHSCCQVDWQLTERNYTYSKNFNKLLEIVSCGGLWRPVASCGHWTDRPDPVTSPQRQLAPVGWCLGLPYPGDVTKHRTAYTACTALLADANGG